MHRLYEVRYVSWPRDVLRKFEYPEVQRLTSTDKGMLWTSNTGETEVLIPWHNIIDITYMEMGEIRARVAAKETASLNHQKLHEEASRL